MPLPYKPMRSWSRPLTLPALMERLMLILDERDQWIGQFLLVRTTDDVLRVDIVDDYIRCLAMSNHCLDGVAPLTSRDEATLETLGWSPADGSCGINPPNFRHDWDFDTPSPTIAAFVARTLASVHLSQEDETVTLLRGYWLLPLLARRRAEERAARRWKTTRR